MKSLPTYDFGACGVGENDRRNDFYVVLERYFKCGVVEDWDSRSMLIAQLMIILLTDHPYVDCVSVGAIDRFDHRHRKMAGFALLADETQQRCSVTWKGASRTFQIT